MPNSDGPADAPPAPRKGAKPTQQEREAHALRANLRRRKQQASLRGETRQGMGAENIEPADEATRD